MTTPRSSLDAYVFAFALLLLLVPPMVEGALVADYRFTDHLPVSTRFLAVLLLRFVIELVGVARLFG